MNKETIYKHLKHLYEGLLDTKSLQYEERLEPLQKLVIYFEEHLSEEAEAGNEEVIKVQNILKEELFEANFYEKAYRLVYDTLARSRDQLKFSPSKFKGLEELLKEVPCKALEETIVKLLEHDTVSIEFLTRCYLAENYGINHPKSLKNRSSLTCDLF